MGPAFQAKSMNKIRQSPCAYGAHTPWVEIDISHLLTQISATLQLWGAKEGKQCHEKVWGVRAGLTNGRPRKLSLRHRWQCCLRHKGWEERWNGKGGRASLAEEQRTVRLSRSEDIKRMKTKQWVHLESLNTLLRKHSRAVFRANCDYEGQDTKCFQCRHCTQKTGRVGFVCCSR